MHWRAGTKQGPLRQLILFFATMLRPAFKTTVCFATPFAGKNKNVKENLLDVPKNSPMN